MVIPLTSHGLISKYFAMPAHTPEIFACCASLKKRLSLSIVFIAYFVLFGFSFSGNKDYGSALRDFHASVFIIFK